MTSESDRKSKAVVWHVYVTHLPHTAQKTREDGAPGFVVRGGEQATANANTEILAFDKLRPE